MEIQRVLEFGQTLLAGEYDASELLSKIEEYSQLFEQFMAAGGLKQSAKDDLQQLADLHAEILELADSARQGTAANLKSLKHRAKGLMAYADNLPKRVSTRKPRKG
ncbi:MAG: hypothetical protein K1X83_10685 [Oligoflexia bacterium]|nr:hypothetical protein [Oligoflexia bacterium]